MEQARVRTRALRKRAGVLLNLLLGLIVGMFWVFTGYFYITGSLHKLAQRFSQPLRRRTRADPPERK